MNIPANQMTSGESERAEAARGCSKCGEKGHNSRTCKAEAKAEAAPEKPKHDSLVPDGARRLSVVSVLRDVNVKLPNNEWDVKQQINYADSQIRNKGKWQIWKCTDGWIHVWHDDVRKVTEIGPANVCFCHPFEG